MMMRSLLSENDLTVLLESEYKIYETLKNETKTTHIKKLTKLREQLMEQLNIKSNQDWFVNTTDKSIPTNICWLLSLGPKYSLPYTKAKFPLFKCIADNEDMVQTLESKEQQEIARSKLTSVIDHHLNNMNLNQRDKILLDTVEQTREFLNKNDDILILSSDKGNKTVAINKDHYKRAMKELLWDMCTYKRLKQDPTYLLQARNNAITDKLYNLRLIDVREKAILVNRTSVAPRLYGLPKIHKPGIPLRPICSSINSPAYGLCKYMVNILKNLTKDSKYNVKDAIEFKSRINNTKIDDDEMLISFDVISLFPSIPVNLAIKTIEKKWNILEQFTNIPQDLFMDIINFCIKDTRYFKYDGNIYEQRKGMPMGSPASPIIADIVMEDLLDVVLSKMQTKPRLVTKYVDDLFAIVKTNLVDDTLNKLNSYNRQIQFTNEVENENKLPYLDAMIKRIDGKIKLDWYQKPTASSRLINFHSKHPRKVIVNTATNFIKRVLEISDEMFHKDNINKIKNVLDKNDFPQKTIMSLIRYVKTKKNNNCDKTPKIYKPITYIHGLSERLKHTDIYDNKKYELAMKTSNTLSKLFSKMKDPLKEEEKSNVIYKINCNGNSNDQCNKVYVGTTKTKLKTRISSHKSDIKALDKPLEQKTALAAHCAVSNHKPDFENVKILQQENNNKRDSH